MTLAALSLASLFVAQQPPQSFRVTGDGGARIEWSRDFASPGNDWVNDIVPMNGHRFLAVGFLDRGSEPSADWQAFASVLDGDGALLSIQKYGAGAGIDAFWSADEADDGRRVFAGFTTRIGAGGIDALVTIVDREGAVLSERAFGGGGYDRFTDLAATGEGYVFLGHSQLLGEDRRRLFAVRTDEASEPVWERLIEGTESYAALYIEPAIGGGFIVAGGIGRGDDSDLIVLKLNDDGREVWRQSIGSPTADDVNHGLTQLPNGNIVVVGYSQSWGSQGNDILAVTLSSSGDVLRREMLGGARDDRPILAKTDSAGRVWIIGYSQSGGDGDWDVIVARLDPEGAFEPGVVTLDSGGDDHGTSLLPLDDGSVLIGGYRRGSNLAGEDAFVLKLSGASFTEHNGVFRRRSVP